MSERVWRGGAYRLQHGLETGPLRAALALAPPHPDEHWLDVATGTGALPRLLAERFERPRRLDAIDTSASMLARVGPLPAGWTVARGDARSLAFATGSVDTVSIAYLLHLLAPGDRQLVLREARRVLRPGGRVLIVTVDARRSATARLLAALPRAGGLRPLDPTAALAGAGLIVQRARFVRSGWPSLCVLARRPPD